MTSRNKSAVRGFETEIEKSREEANWKKAVELALQLKARSPQHGKCRLSTLPNTVPGKRSFYFTRMVSYLAIDECKKWRWIICFIKSPCPCFVCFSRIVTSNQVCKIITVWRVYYNWNAIKKLSKTWCYFCCLLVVGYLPVQKPPG